MAESASDLQLMLDGLNEWCSSNSMMVNASKSNVIHFRPNSVPKVAWNFKCDENDLLLTDRYT